MFLASLPTFPRSKAKWWIGWWILPWKPGMIFIMGFARKEVMEARYPTSHRTYTKLKDMQICGADMGIIHVEHGYRASGYLGSVDRQPQESLALCRSDRLGYTFSIVYTPDHLAGIGGTCLPTYWHQRPRRSFGPRLSHAWMLISRINWN